MIFKNLGWIGGYAPLIVPSFFGNGFFIFMMRQFFLGLPKELDDAARVDGASEFRIFWQIMLPLVRPALLVMGVVYVHVDLAGILRAAGLPPADRRRSPCRWGCLPFADGAPSTGT